MSEMKDLFVWSKRFETGLAEVDAQHRHLVQMINRLARLAGTCSNHELQRLIDELQDYTRYHFRTEENLMRTHQIDPEFRAAHEHAHASLIEQAHRMRLMAQQAGDHLAEAVSLLLPFLTKWLVFHILGTDMRMAHEIHSRQAGVAARTAHRDASLRQSESLAVLVDALDGLTDNLSMRSAQLIETNRRMRLSETRYALAQRVSHIGSWEFDPQTRAFLCLEGLEPLKGRTPTTPAPSLDDFLACVPAEDRPLIVAALASVHDAGDSLVMEHRVFLADGSLRWLEVRGELVQAPDTGRPTLVGIVRDVTEEHVAQEQLRDTNRQLLLSLTSLEHHAADLTRLNEFNESLRSSVTVSEVCEVLEHCMTRLRLGVSGTFSVPAPAGGADLLRACTWGRPSRVRPVFPASACWAIRRGLRYVVESSGDRPPCRHFEAAPEHGYLCHPLQVLGETLGLLTIEFPATASEVDRTRINHLASMVAESLKLALSNIHLRETLHERATRDPLTGLLNRRYLDETLPRELHRAQREQRALTIAMLDLDHFKIFNDTWGHEAGDAVLEEVAAVIRAQLRASDLACRFGGEEIVIVMLGAEVDEARERIGEIAQSVRKTRVHLQSITLPPITFSAGIAQAFVHGSTAVDLLRAADRALYAAKDAGRDCIVVAPTPD